MSVYLDCNATTPLDPAVQDVLMHYLVEEFGNEGSRTHEFGARAKQAVQRARDQVASAVGCTRDEVIFTSGATEANNLAILGLAQHGLLASKRHIITTAIEHKAVLEPCEKLAKQGFEVTYLPVGPSGAVDPMDLQRALRADTLLVSVMHVNNETGIRQPLEAIAAILEKHPAFFHTDAAQGFGKDMEVLRSRRIDLVSLSGHKVYGPKGIGALICRRRGYERAPLQPLMFGGGQERGLRPGTLPVALVAALGCAAELAQHDEIARRERCQAMRAQALEALAPLSPRLTGDVSRAVPHTLNLSFERLNSEALMVALKDLVAISNGSACTSSSYKPSHVLKAMGMSDQDANGCIRISWSHLTPDVDWQAIANRIQSLR